MGWKHISSMTVSYTHLDVYKRQVDIFSYRCARWARRIGQGFAAARKGFKEAFPEAAALLGKMKFDSVQIGSLMDALESGEGSEAERVRTWIAAHEDLVQSLSLIHICACGGVKYQWISHVYFQKNRSPTRFQ